MYWASTVPHPPKASGGCRRMPADHGRGCQVLDDAIFFDSTVDDKNSILQSTSCTIVQTVERWRTWSGHVWPEELQSSSAMAPPQFLPLQPLGASPFRSISCIWLYSWRDSVPAMIWGFGVTARGVSSVPTAQNRGRDGFVQEVGAGRRRRSRDLPTS
jgi:hypothetical protein